MEADTQKHSSKAYSTRGLLVGLKEYSTAVTPTLTCARNCEMRVTRTKAHLRNATAPQIGSIGEQVYRHHMENSGHRVEAIHYNGYDFLIDGRTKVDVKTTNREKPRRQKNTSFQAVELVYVALAVEDDSTPIQIFNANLKSIGILPATTLQKIEGLKIDRHRRANDSKRYWRRILPSNFKLVYRSGASTTQRAMAKKGWGPQAFYDNSGRIDCVVAIFEDDAVFQYAHAYPIWLKNEIKFFPVNQIIKSKGSHLMTYEPLKLHKKFQFFQERTLLSDILTRFKFNQPKSSRVR